ncbi:MAG: hypothetical protein GY938_16900 [Ketobacter sp.]|nr:hypothetical protein [Ketobacter sp.]
MKQLSLFKRPQTAVTVTVNVTVNVTVKNTGKKVTAVYTMPRDKAEALCNHWDEKLPEYRHEVSE